MVAVLGGTAMSIGMEARAQLVADADNAGSLAEIVVTAEKRTTTVQDTPIDITAIGGDELQERGVPSLGTLLEATPGASMKSEGPSQTEYEMRGMTSSGGNTATVGFYLDDIPLTGSPSAQNGHVVIDPDLYDLSRIEVLRGPQGTLFGSGSMGGTIRMITNQPNLSQYQASAQSILSGTDGGGFNHTDNVMVNLPLISDTMALRLVGTENYRSGWIDRIVENSYPAVNGAGTAFVSDPASAPFGKDYTNSDAYRLDSIRATLLWKPTDDLSITPGFFFEESRQNGPDAYDSVSATDATPDGKLAHYEPFDIAEPLSDRISAYSLNVNYRSSLFDVTSSTAYWTRLSAQTQDASLSLNDPAQGVTLYAANGNNPAFPGQSYYGPNGSGAELSTETDPSAQFSEELRLNSNGSGKLEWVGGLYYSHIESEWNFNGITPNYSSFADAFTGNAATSAAYIDVYQSVHIGQYAAFGDATYALTDKLKLDVGGRVTRFEYYFTDCHSGWGSALGAATPSCTGVIELSSGSFNPKVDLSYDFSHDLKLYATVSSGFRPGGANPLYPTTFGTWGAAFQKMGFTGNKWPDTYEPDSVWSYELGEKGRFFNDRLTVDASIYDERWQHIQLEAWPANWAENINGNHATILGADVDARARLGAGFELQLAAGVLNETLDGGPHWDIPPLDVLPEVEKFNGSAALNYSAPLSNGYTFTARLENTYTGPRYTNTFPVPVQAFGEYQEMAGYDLTNIRAGIRSERGWAASLFVNNAFNKHAQLETLWMEAIYSSANNRIVTNQPLTAGIDLSFHL
jgi:outer membrane receptor protein involved in Fe transport